MERKRIYDIGANDGSDSAYYLAKGFDVVAVEADPSLCEQIRARLKTEIDTGQLTLLNIGVSDTRGVATLYRNEVKHDWSSLIRETKATQEFTHYEVEIPTVPLSDIIAENGAPYYIKIDIEGSESKAISSLSTDKDLPVYLSYEVNEDWHSIANALTSLGFDEFQLVQQGAKHLAPPTSPSREGAYHPVTFTGHHSGNFGLDLADAWVSRSDLDAIMDDLARQREQMGSATISFWHDIHARQSQKLDALGSA